MIPTLLWLFNTLIDLYIWVIIAMVIMSWLTAFNVLNPRSPFVAQVGRALDAITSPVMAPVRRIIPSIGGLDISPIIVLLILETIQHLVNSWALTGSLLGV
ncbi:MAG TPA: YggT family protein [Caulobacteraceae bacterium]|jgi:YggT family protein|nr:YggT family protein [Caulobacteraceae bacterium]